MEQQPQPEQPAPTRSFFSHKASWQHRKRLLRIESWGVVILSYLLIIFAYAFPTDFRNTNPWHVGAAWSATIIRTFLFHGGLLLAVIAAISAWTRCWRLLAATVPLLLVSLGPAIISYLPKSPQQTTGPTISVMSVNLLMINEETIAMIDEIEATNPDLLLLQEYTDHWHTALTSRLQDKYPHRIHVARDDSFGAAVYSKRPFAEKPQLYTQLGSATEPQIRCLIDLDGHQLAVYNIHLLPPWGMAYTIENRTQFADLLDTLQAEEIPVIMAGDFNFTDTSPNATALTNINMTDSYDLAGWGRGATWPVKSFFRWIPSIRLDHIYISKELTCTTCRTGTGPGSDHRPISATIGLRPITELDAVLSVAIVTSL